MKSKTDRGHLLCQFIHHLHITKIYRPELADGTDHVILTQLATLESTAS